MKKLLLLALVMLGGVVNVSAAKLYISIENVTWWTSLRVYASNDSESENNGWKDKTQGIVASTTNRLGKTWYAFDMGDYTKAQVQQYGIDNGNLVVYNQTFTITVGDEDRYVIIDGSYDSKNDYEDGGVKIHKYGYAYYEAPAYRGNGSIGWSQTENNMTVKDNNTVSIDLTKTYVDAIGDGQEIRFRIYNFGNQLYPNTNGAKVAIAGSGVTEISNGSSDNYFSIDKPAYVYDHITVTAAYNTSTSKWTVSSAAYISKTASGTNADASLGYSTFGAETDVDLSSLPSGVTAETATVDASGKITYYTATELAAGEGALLTNTTGEDVVLSIPVKASAGAVAGNALRRVASASLAQTQDVDEVTYTNYILTKNTTVSATDELGWYKVNDKGSTGLIVNTAYLRVNKAATSRGFFPLWSEDVTAIEKLTPAQSEGVVFDLQGRRVAQPTKGLYIVNGKKVIMK